MPFRTITVSRADVPPRRRIDACSALAQRQAVGFALLLGLVAACSAPPRGSALATPLTATPIPPAPPAPPDDLSDRGTPALDAVLLQHVPEGTFGPYLGNAAEGRTVALWAAPAEGSGNRWFSLSLDARHVPRGPAISLADAPADLALASVSGTAQGFIALATSTSTSGDAGTRLEALTLGKAGELVAGPTPIVHSHAEILWVHALQVGASSVALWATLALTSADIHLAALNLMGTPLSAPLRVLEGARAWQAVEFGDGIALAALLRVGNDGAHTVRVMFLDNQGRVLGQTDVASGAHIEPQLDAARVGDNLVLCWLQRDGLDRRLYSAALGSDTRLLAKPRALAPPFGDQRLLELIPTSDPSGDAILAWEQLDQAPRGQRRVQLGRVSDRADLQSHRAELTFIGGADQSPELARKGNGIAAITRASACARDAVPCTDQGPVPTFVELGPELDVLASEPLRLSAEKQRIADLAWGLHCNAQTCAALGALPTAPVPIFGIELRARSDAWRAAAARVGGTWPRPLELRTLRETPEPLRDVVAAKAGTTWLVASLSQFDDNTPYVTPKTPAPDGRLAPVRAKLSVQPFAPSGLEAGASRIISYRARSASGLSLARASDDRALLAWSALDRQQPEVFATLLGRGGQSLKQRMLSSGAGEVTQVAAGALPRGFVVAWVGDQGAEASAFSTRVDAELGGGSPQHQVSRGAGVTTAISLLTLGDAAWLAQVRRTENEHSLVLTRLDAHTAAPLGEDLPIQHSESSAFVSPVLVARGASALLAWIERPEVANAEGPRVWLQELDGEARRKGEPLALALGATGEPHALGILCEAGGCQGVIDNRAASGHALEGFRWDGAQAPADVQVLVRRDGSARDPAAFALTPSGVFYADRRDQGGLLRRVGVGWR
jgi:hypothetical protein